MINLSESRLTTLVVHKVGNKVRSEGVLTAQELYPLDEDMALLMRDHYLSAFKHDEFFKFTHESDLKLNEIYTYCQQLFSQSREDFVEISVHILNHLYGQSVHPHIKSGELHVAHFRECEIDGTQLEAIGIFKSENKDYFLTFPEAEKGLDIELKEGVPLKKLDKGCLIFNAFQDDGFSLLLLDKEDTQYWRDDFLHVQRIQDNSFQTQNFLHMTHEFCDEILAPEQNTADQLVFLNRSLQYFSKNEELDVEAFKQETLATPQHREAFDAYRQHYEGQDGLVASDEGFPISKYAVRRMRKEFKPLIKLDTQVEIRLAARRTEDAADYLEKGFDEQRGMYYYKVYFNEELE